MELLIWICFLGVEICDQVISAKLLGYLPLLVLPDKNDFKSEISSLQTCRFGGHSILTNFQNFCTEGLAQLQKRRISSVLTLGSISDNWVAVVWFLSVILLDIQDFVPPNLCQKRALELILLVLMDLQAPIFGLLNIIAISFLEFLSTLLYVMLRDPRRLYVPGRLYHIVERKPFRYEYTIIFFSGKM